ncbi:MAG: hypothetical protein H6Q09_901, partial [Acidobacteria bacterium]|nr:hypothetical protein [Acidobacteriota bacterium]
GSCERGRAGRARHRRTGARDKGPGSDKGEHPFWLLAGYWLLNNGYDASEPLMMPSTSSNDSQ